MLGIGAVGSMIDRVDKIGGFAGDRLLLDVGIPHRGLDISVTQDFLDLVEI